MSKVNHNVSIFHSIPESFSFSCRSQLRRDLLEASFVSSLYRVQRMYYKASTQTDFVVVKTGLPNIYSPSTSFVVVKTGLSNFYRPSTGFAVLKSGLPNFYRASTGFAVVKTGLQLLVSTQIAYQHRDKVMCMTCSPFHVCDASI